MKVEIDLGIKYMPLIDQIVLVATLDTLQQEGWELDEVEDSEETYPIASTEEAIETLAGIEDYLKVRFHKGEQKSWFLYIPGNGIDCIADYGMSCDASIQRADEICRSAA